MTLTPFLVEWSEVSVTFKGGLCVIPLTITIVVCRSYLLSFNYALCMSRFLILISDSSWFFLFFSVFFSFLFFFISLAIMLLVLVSECVWLCTFICNVCMCVCVCVILWKYFEEKFTNELIVNMFTVVFNLKNLHKNFRHIYATSVWIKTNIQTLLQAIEFKFLIFNGLREKKKSNQIKI